MPRLLWVRGDRFPPNEIAAVTTFGQSYAPQYDRLYADKDYQAECTLLEQAFRRYGQQPIRSLLDLGCGTGGHAFPLAARGYLVTGVDSSEAMLREAKRKPASASAAPEFLRGDIRDLDLGRQFDAALMMFAVLGYQTSDSDVQGALASARLHLRPGGLLAGDFWYGPTVLRVAPSDRVKRVQLGGVGLVRSATTELDLGRHLATVHYRLTQVNGQAEALVGEETHRMRFFFPQELERFLAEAELELVGLHPFPDLDSLLDSTTWNAFFCARAR